MSKEPAHTGDVMLNCQTPNLGVQNASLKNSAVHVNTHDNYVHDNIPSTSPNDTVVRNIEPVPGTTQCNNNVHHDVRIPHNDTTVEYQVSNDYSHNDVPNVSNVNQNNTESYVYNTNNTLNNTLWNNDIQTQHHTDTEYYNNAYLNSAVIPSEMSPFMGPGPTLPASRLLAPGPLVPTRRMSTTQLKNLKCQSCEKKSTSYWRVAWKDFKLCNSCALRFQKLQLACPSCLYVPYKNEYIVNGGAQYCPKCAAAPLASSEHLPSLDQFLEMAGRTKAQLTQAAAQAVSQAQPSLLHTAILPTQGLVDDLPSYSAPNGHNINHNYTTSSQIQSNKRPLRDLGTYDGASASRGHSRPAMTHYATSSSLTSSYNGNDGNSNNDNGYNTNPAAYHSNQQSPLSHHHHNSYNTHQQHHHNPRPLDYVNNTNSFNHNNFASGCSGPLFEQHSSNTSAHQHSRQTVGSTNHRHSIHHRDNHITHNTNNTTTTNMNTNHNTRLHFSAQAQPSNSHLAASSESFSPSAPNVISNNNTVNRLSGHSALPHLQYSVGLLAGTSGILQTGALSSINKTHKHNTANIGPSSLTIGIQTPSSASSSTQSMTLPSASSLSAPRAPKMTHSLVVGTPANDSVSLLTHLVNPFPGSSLRHGHATPSHRSVLGASTLYLSGRPSGSQSLAQLSSNSTSSSGSSSASAQMMNPPSSLNHHSQQLSLIIEQVATQPQTAHQPQNSFMLTPPLALHTGQVNHSLHKSLTLLPTRSLIQDSNHQHTSQNSSNKSNKTNIIGPLGLHTTVSKVSGPINTYSSTPGSESSSSLSTMSSSLLRSNQIQSSMYYTTPLSKNSSLAHANENNSSKGSTSSSFPALYHAVQRLDTSVSESSVSTSQSSVSSTVHPPDSIQNRQTLSTSDLIPSAQPLASVNQPSLAILSSRGHTLPDTDTDTLTLPVASRQDHSQHHLSRHHYPNHPTTTIATVDPTTVSNTDVRVTHIKNTAQPQLVDISPPHVPIPLATPSQPSDAPSAHPPTSSSPGSSSLSCQSNTHSPSTKIPPTLPLPSGHNILQGSTYAPSSPSPSRALGNPSPIDFSSPIQGEIQNHSVVQPYTLLPPSNQHQSSINIHTSQIVSPQTNDATVQNPAVVPSSQHLPEVGSNDSNSKPVTYTKPQSYHINSITSTLPNMHQRTDQFR